MPKVTELSDFGLPDRVMNTSKVSFVSFLPMEFETPSGKKLAAMVAVVCDGADLKFEFFEGEEENAKRFFDYMKKCIYENE